MRPHALVIYLLILNKYLPEIYIMMVAVDNIKKILILPIFAEIFQIMRWYTLRICLFLRLHLHSEHRHSLYILQLVYYVKNVAF